MKKLFLILICAAMCVGCSPDYSFEAEAERQMELDELKAEIYNQAYEEGYNDAVEDVIDSMPCPMINVYELEDYLNDILFEYDSLECYLDSTVDCNEFANELRDQLFSYCKLYDRTDFEIPYSNLGMDYAY